MDGAENVFVQLVEVEMEVEFTRRRAEFSAEQFALIDHVEVTLVVEASQQLQLFHHEFTHDKLVDDFLGLGASGRHAVHVELYVQLVLVLQSVDAAVGLDGQLLVGCVDGDVAEAHAVFVARHPCLEAYRHLELVQHGSEGLGDVLQLGGARDERRSVGQLATQFLAGEGQGGVVELHGRIGHLDDDIAQVGALFGGRYVEVQVGDVEV